MTYYVHDDCFSNPDEIRSLALKQVYHEPLSVQGWKGYRTNELSRDEFPFIYQTVEKQVNYTFPPYEGKVPYEVECYFHYTTKESILNEHRDSGYFAAGIIYLFPNPSSQTGTKILNDVVENQYNRMVYYESNQLHGIVNAFGDNVENSRLTLTFFIPYPPFHKYLKSN
jgi:hypothetical protein